MIGHAGGKLVRIPFVYRMATLLLALTLAGGCGRGEKSAGLVGEPAPEFTVTLLDGGEQSLRKLKGRPILLEFWAPWCPGCLMNVPPLKRLHANYGDRVAFIAASSETGRNALNRFVRDRALPYPVALSNRELLAAYRVMAIPVTVLIDADGIIRYHHVGQFSYETLAEQLHEMTGMEN